MDSLVGRRWWLLAGGLAMAAWVSLPAGAVSISAARGAARTAGRPTTASLLERQIASVGAVGSTVVHALENWGCLAEVAGAPGADAGQYGAGASIHDFSTCRPLPVTSRNFPVFPRNPGADHFTSEAATLLGFARTAPTLRWPPGSAGTVTALRRVSAELAAQLQDAVTEVGWSEGVRQSLVRLEVLVQRVQHQLSRH